MTSFTTQMNHSLLSLKPPVVVSPHHPTQHKNVVIPQPLIPHTWQRVSTTTGASAPPWMHREYLISVSQFSKFADPRTSCNSARKAAVRCLWTLARVKILETTEAWPHRRLSSRPSLPNRPCCICTILVASRSDCPHAIPSVAGICSSPWPAYFRNSLHSTGSLSSCGRSTRTVVHHLENTLRSVIAWNPHEPFSSLASGFLTNTKQRIFTLPGHGILL